MAAGLGFPAIPRLLVTIVVMSISFFIWPQVGGLPFCVYLTSSHFLGHPLVSGRVSLSGSLFWGESSSLSLLIFGTRGVHEAWQTVMVPTLGFLHLQEKHKHALDPTSGQDCDHAFCQSTHFSKESEAWQSAPVVANAFQWVLNLVLDSSKN
jgi:hypothetical protein